MGDNKTDNLQNGRTSAHNLDDGISRLDRTLNKIYLPEIMAARRVIHSRMRKKKERQMTGPPRNGPTLYDYIMESRRRKGGSQPVSAGDQPLEDVPEADEKREHPAPTRQDSTFQSVDLSEIAGLREDPNRTPTPQPTFERNERQANKAAAVAALSSDKTQVNSRSSSGHSSTRSEEVIQEGYELQLKPGYADAQQIEMATAAYRVNQHTHIQRRNSYETTTQRTKLEHRSDSTVSDPGEFKEKSVKKKTQNRQANDLDLAQKIILKRKVEEYIDNQEPGTTIEEVSESNTGAWDEQTEENHVTEETTETNRKLGRESVQTVISHKSHSPADSPDNLHQEITETSREVVRKQNSVRADSASSNSRPSTAGSDLNPHPVIPAIGSRQETSSPPVSNSPPASNSAPASNSSPATSPQTAEESDNDVAVGAAVTAGVVAAGAGTAAAVAIKAKKSEKAKKSKHSEKTKEKKDKKHSATAAQPTEKSDVPKVKSSAADAASANKPTKPNKKEKSKDKKKPLSLIDMPPSEMASTIDALEKMVDANIQGVIDNTKGKKTKSKEPEADRRMVKAVMNPAFQAEINSFLAQT